MNPPSLLSIPELKDKLQEGCDCEFKSASGGLPGSLWESYSAMANTDGGIIVLGIKEHHGEFEFQGVARPNDLRKQFWDIIHNRNKISINLLSENDVRDFQFKQKMFVMIRVPRADRHQRPVFIGQNPLDGTFRRYHEGDYKCSQDEVARMLADKSKIPSDSRILDKFTMKDVDADSLRQYRNRFSAHYPSHPWLQEDDRSFLRKLGGWRSGRDQDQDGPTVAGILMFGNEDAITELSIELKYQLDYRERVSDAIADRWSDRITIDGTWTPNLFQFFLKVYPKLTTGLKLPFAYVENPPSLFHDPIRRGMTPVHEAIQEALVNALIHADYTEGAGIVIDKFPDRIILANPGTLLVSMEQIRHGTVSECRNPSLQKMFQMMGACDKAGSGLDKIRQGWAYQKWFWPQIYENQKPDRVILNLPMVSLLPEESVQKIKKALTKSEFEELTANELQALVTAEVEGKVSNPRLQQFSNEHAHDITKMLQHLVACGYLMMDGYGRWASYRLSHRLSDKNDHFDRPDGENSQHNGSNSTRNVPGSIHKAPDSIRSDIKKDASPISDVEEKNLLVIAEPARKQARLLPEKMQEIIYQLCHCHPLTVSQMASLLQRNNASLQARYLRKMVKEKRLRLLYPNQPNHPDQAYLAVFLEDDSEQSIN